jgi:hypothetical protein
MISKLNESTKEIDLFIKVLRVSSNNIILVTSINFDRDRYFYLGLGSNLKISDISEIW